MEDNPNVLALDPSSVVVGYAQMRSATDVVNGGIITPPDRKAPYWDRVYKMRHDLRTLLAKMTPKIILVESPSGHVGANTHKGQGFGLPIYGYAVGAIAAEAEIYAEMSATAEVVNITEDVWTRRVKKSDRQAAIAAMFPSYVIAEDPGADLADAIGLGYWYFTEQAAQDATRGPH
jgi:Holliday junction resolvasome RuvABC endonuclease subunit